MFKTDRTIHMKNDRTNFILLHVIEIFQNKLLQPFSITLMIKTSLILLIKTKFS